MSMLLCIFDLFILGLKKKLKQAMQKRILLNAQNLQLKTKIIQIESKITSTT